MGTIFESLQEQSRLNITNDIRRLIVVDNHEAVKIVVRPKVNKEVFPDAIIREGVGEFTLRAEEAGIVRSWWTGSTTSA